MENGGVQGERHRQVARLPDSLADGLANIFDLTHPWAQEEMARETRGRSLNNLIMQLRKVRRLGSDNREGDGV